MAVGDSIENRPSRGGRSTRELGTQSKNRGLSSHEVVAMAAARVTTASSSPRNRNAGKPISTAATAPATPATGMASSRSRFQSRVALAPTAAPMANSATCPSDTWPAHPVSTTTEQPRSA
jgi:hypothetical protein